jgi:hypothetical protein
MEPDARPITLWVGAKADSLAALAVLMSMRLSAAKRVLAPARIVGPRSNMLALRGSSITVMSIQWSQSERVERFDPIDR